MTFRKNIFVILALGTVIALAGCEAEQAKKTSKPFFGKLTQANLELNYEPGQTFKYKSKVEFRKDYKFEQPSLNKTNKKITRTTTEIIYDQTIEEVDNKGNAVANITIKGFKYSTHSPKGEQTVFDSCKETDTNLPLMRLIGKSYKIKLSPAGKVIALIDAKDLHKAVEGTDAKKTVSVLFGSENIKKTHSILALPDTDKAKTLVGASWSRVQSAPKGMLQPKNYEKIYTLKDISTQKGENIAIIELSAIPTSKKPEDGQISDPGMGVFARMFTGSDDYTGKLALDIDSGKIKSYREKLVAVWIAAEPPESQRSDKGPDVITMGFTWDHTIEAVD